MKSTRFFLTLLIIAFFLFASNTAQATGSTDRKLIFCADSVEISLLTCAPGQEVYSLYGHTAIRYTDISNGVDVAVNYGMFSFKKPFFILRFIFGLTDYEMGIVPFDAFKAEYMSEERYVVQQVLNLTAQEKESIARAISLNYEPKNRTYRYNYFYDNCTTRARDILTDNINGEVIYTEASKMYPSYRALTHLYNERHPWARYGNDLLLGLKADSKTNISQHQFLPFILKENFNNAVIRDKNGIKRPLVSKRFYVVNESTSLEDSDDNWLSMIRPHVCSWLFFFIVVCVTLTEAKMKRIFWLFDSLLMLITGCAGIIIFIMFFSQHPTTSTNLQIILLNPIPLLYVCKVAKNTRNHKKHPFWKYSIIAILLFFIGGLVQDYAEGMNIVALSLLLRCVWNYIFPRPSFLLSLMRKFEQDKTKKS